MSVISCACVIPLRVNSAAATTNINKRIFIARVSRKVDRTEVGEIHRVRPATIPQLLREGKLPATVPTNLLNIKKKGRPKAPKRFRRRRPEN